MVDPEEPQGLAWRWTVVYVLNLLLPLSLGLLVTSGPGGTVGMMTAVFAYWLVGVAGSYHLPRVTRAVTDGGIFVAMFQFLPLGHFAAGIVAVLAWDKVTGHPPFNPGGWRAEVGGFGVTVLTALPLMLVAWVLGGGPRVLFAPPVARTGDEADYIEGGPTATGTETAKDAFELRAPEQQ